MCTVTVHRAEGRVLVTMNRDEARDRGPEIAPVAHPGETSWIAPADSQRGGSWIGVNEHGAVACLMNGYIAGDGPAPATGGALRTRGEIVPWLMAQGTARDMHTALAHEFDPAPYPAFTAIVVDASAVESFAWRGAGAFLRERHAGVWSFFSSSSWRTDDVIAWRRRAFEEWRRGGCAMRGTLPALHLLHPEGQCEWSPLMDRERTCTRSITQIEFAADAACAEVRYWRRDALDAGMSPHRTTLPLHGTRKHAGRV